MYLKRLKKYIDTEFVKVITGVRRSGQSYLLKIPAQELKDRGIERKDIIFLNFESFIYITGSNSDLLSGE